MKRSRNKITAIVTVVAMLLCFQVVYANPIPGDMSFSPRGQVFFETGEHYITMSVNASSRVPNQEPELRAVLQELQANPGKSLYLYGFVSDPPKYSANNQANQLLLAQNRAWSVARWFINNGISRNRIRIFEKVARGMDAYTSAAAGHAGPNYADQRVDIYMIDEMLQPSITDVVLDLAVVCPPGYQEYRHPEERTMRDGVMTISMTVECRPDIAITTPQCPGPGCDPDPPVEETFLQDPKYWAYTLGGTALGCGGGWAASGIEGGEGARDGDREGGDGGGICENDAQCIITGCLIGWGGSQIGYWVDRSLTDFDRNRRR